MFKIVSISKGSKPVICDNRYIYNSSIVVLGLATLGFFGFGIRVFG